MFVAVTDLGLSPSEFWDLTWYDWGLYVLRLYRSQQEKKASREFQMELTRRFMALYANSNLGKGQRAFTPEDFFKLSYDNINTSAPKENVFHEVGRKLGGTIKPKKK